MGLFSFWNGGLMLDDAFSKVLLHFDGTDTSTTFTDESGKTWTSGGNAQIDTAQSVFGGASLLLDGTGDSIHTSDSADFDFGTGDFTIDFRLRYNGSPTGTQTFFSQRSGTKHEFYYDGSQLYFDSGPTLGVNWTPSSGTWYHIALVRNGNNFMFFVDGTQVGTTQVSASATNNLATDAYIGAREDGSNGLNGWLDEYRISKGIARWTSNFTPPTSAYGITQSSTGFFMFF